MQLFWFDLYCDTIFFFLREKLNLNNTYETLYNEFIKQWTWQISRSLKFTAFQLHRKVETICTLKVSFSAQGVSQVTLVHLGCLCRNWYDITWLVSVLPERKLEKYRFMVIRLPIQICNYCDNLIVKYHILWIYHNVDVVFLMCLCV